MWTVLNSRADLEGHQLREQDFGNFQDFEGKRREKAERLRFGRFWYRFPNGESGADVYDRMTLFEDHLIRDINAGRFCEDTNLILITHGLTLRIFLMRWFHWSVTQMLCVYNPKNGVPLTLERIDDASALGDQEQELVHTKGLYRLAEASRDHLVGCTDEMCIGADEGVTHVVKELKSHTSFRLGAGGNGMDPRDSLDDHSLDYGATESRDGAGWPRRTSNDVA